VAGRRFALRNFVRSLRRGLVLTVGIGLLLVVAVVVPRAIDGYSALQWTRFHAARVGAGVGAGSRAAGDHARRAGEAAARAVNLTAPFPWAGEAARLALDSGRAIQPSNPAVAAALFADVRGALDRATASPLRGLGLWKMAEEARSLDEAARSARTDGR
jgi:hypothetical protein